PAGGVDKGGTSWTRVVKPWFPAWCDKRDRVPHQQIDIARLALGVSYARPAAAAHWLAEVFGFESVDELPERPDPLPEGEHRPPRTLLPDFPALRRRGPWRPRRPESASHRAAPRRG